MQMAKDKDDSTKLSVQDLKKALLSYLYSSYYFRGAHPSVRDASSTTNPEFDPRLINRFMCNYDPVNETNIAKDWEVNEEKRYFASMIPFPKVSRQADGKLTYSWSIMCLRPSNRYYDNTSSIISLIDFLTQYTQTPAEPEAGNPLKNLQDLTRFVKTDLPKITKSGTSLDGSTTTYKNNTECYKHPYVIMVAALVYITNNLDKSKFKDSSDGIVESELKDYDARNKTDLYDRWKNICKSISNYNCEGDAAATAVLIGRAKTTEDAIIGTVSGFTAGNSTNDCTEATNNLAEATRYSLLGYVKPADGNTDDKLVAQYGVYSQAGFLDEWDSFTKNEMAGSFSDGVVSSKFSFADKTTTDAVADYNSNQSNYIKAITSVSRYQALEDYVPDYNSYGVGLFMGMVDEGYFKPEDLIYEGPNRIEGVDPKFDNIRDDIRMIAADSEKRNTTETVLLVFIIIIFVLLILFFIFYLARSSNVAKLAKSQVQELDSQQPSSDDY